MIIKGQARGRSRQLAAHLLRRDQNEDIRLYELRGVVASDVAGALAEMEALTAAVHSKRPLYHGSISPEAHTPLSPDQIRIAADTLERKLGLDGQPRLIVVHRKQAREHLHVVWSRIDVERQRVISDGWNYRAHEEAARELEAAFGHRVVRGAHVPRGFAPRPRRAPKDYEYRQAERSGLSPAEVSAELTALWQGSGDAQAFRKKLAEAGYTLARGDRRVFVVIDRAGTAHSLARRLGMRSHELGVRLGGPSLGALPSVTEARQAIRRSANWASLHSRYRAAAAELAAPATPCRPPPMVARRLARDIGAAIGWINMPGHAPQAIIRRATVRPAARDRRRYQAMRAIVLAEFASKIDAAYALMTGEALSSALARLAQEREAALRALERLNPKDEPGGTRGASRRRRATPRLRFHRARGRGPRRRGQPA
jgi:hypothetical protein